MIKRPILSLIWTTSSTNRTFLSTKSTSPISLTSRPHQSIPPPPGPQTHTKRSKSTSTLRSLRVRSPPPASSTHTTSPSSPPKSSPPSTTPPLPQSLPQHTKSKKEPPPTDPLELAVTESETSKRQKEKQKQGPPDASTAPGDSHAETAPEPRDPPPVADKEETSKGKGKETVVGLEGSLYKRFRSRNDVLSVSDLTSPIWCEVQYEYGLLQSRSKDPEKRKASFKTSAGKEIKVDMKVAQNNHQRTEMGTSVHKVLEREIAPVEKIVHAVTKEERWALEMVKMIDCLQSLVEIGRCREMNVVGILDDQLVKGIIDEVIREPIYRRSSTPEGKRDRKRGRADAGFPSTPSKRTSKKATLQKSPSQTSINAFFSTSPRKPSPHKDNRHDPMTGVISDDEQRSSSPSRIPTSRPRPAFRLRILDTKSRHHPSLPPSEDTVSSRLQLMFYHRLLSSMLAPPGSPDATDYEEIWRRAGLLSTKKFSGKFTLDTELPAEIDCLEKVLEMLRNTIEMLNVDGIRSTLTIEYRITKRSLSANKRKKSPHRRRESETEAEDIKAAIAASLKDLSPEQVVAIEVPASPPGVRNALLDDSSTVTSAALPVPVASDESDKATAKMDPVPEANAGASTSESVPSGAQAGKTDRADPKEDYRSLILGTKTFEYDDAVLQRHLDDVLQWWYGNRPSRGVEVALTRRCHTCEYADGCEWREKKAMEALHKSKAKIKLDVNKS
ncbi:hypothetical protein BDW22DRAFT_1350396 [Trametopsis cervina]|nr:hypothetical protein BDW22DRAFT_1350396 [Trametopsis cervina]